MGNLDADGGIELNINYSFIKKELDFVSINPSEEFKKGVKIGLFMGNRKAYARLLLKELQEPKLSSNEENFLRAMRGDEKELFGTITDAKEFVNEV